MIVGAVANGAVGEAWSRVGTASFAEVYLSSWIGLFPATIGLFALALFAFLAAVYLAYGARDPELREDFRRRAIASAIVALVLGLIGLIEARVSAPLQGFAAIAALIAIVALWRRHYGIARIAAGAQVTLVLWGWAIEQFPFMIPNVMTIRAAAAPSVTLKLLLIGLAAGTAILIPALRYLYGIFARKATAP
jgi:cytochrome d ubiquinol oxidase subunit II